MRKTLPNDIKEILASGDVEAVAEAGEKLRDWLHTCGANTESPSSCTSSARKRSSSSWSLEARTLTVAMNADKPPFTAALRTVDPI